jgi:hypothetical protein
MRRLFLCLMMTGLLLKLSAQPTPVLTTEKTKIFIGEPFRVTLELKAVDRSATVQWIIPDTLEHFEWITKDTTDLLKRTYTLTSWDSGTWKLEPLQVLVPSNVDGKPVKLYFTAAEIRVEYDTTGSNLLNDIKPIVEVKDAGEQWIGYVVTAAALIGLLALWLLFRRRRHLTQTSDGVQDTGSSYDQLRAVIAELRTTDWENPLQQKQALARVRSAFRSYLAQSVGTVVAASTTDQLGVHLQQQLQRPQLLELLQVYRLTDVVLFARFQATVADCQAALDTIESVANAIQTGGNP